MVLQSLSSPATSTSRQHAQDEEKQLTSLIKRNPAAALIFKPVFDQIHDNIQQSQLQSQSTT